VLFFRYDLNDQIKEDEKERLLGMHEKKSNAYRILVG
jgi:hypothetical protein